MVFYSAITSNKIAVHVKTQMNLKISMQGGKASQRVYTLWFHLGRTLQGADQSLPGDIVGKRVMSNVVQLQPSHFATFWRKLWRFLIKLTNISYMT